MGLESIFPGLPPTPADVAEDLGDLWTGVTEWLGGYGPSEESIHVGNLVKGILAGPGAGGLYRAKQVTERQVDTQTDLAGQAHEIVARLETAWSGTSSDGARQLIRSFADIADESSTVLASNARNLQRQVDGFERMKNSLERMPDPPPEKAGLDPDIDGSSKKAIREYQRIAERNRLRYQSYVDDTNDNLGDLNEYFPDLPAMNERGGGPEPWSRPRPEPSPRYTPAPSGPRPGPGGGWGGSGSGAGSPYRPDFMPSPYVGSDYAGGSGYSGSGYGGTTAASFGPGSGGAGAGFGPGAGGAGGFGPGAGGAGAGAGGTGAGGMSGVAGPMSGAGGAGAGAGGAGAGAGAARGAGGLGPRGGGMGGAPMGGAGRGQGGDDEDYERKSWLQENDPEGLFGTDEMTPPLVLGADEDE